TVRVSGESFDETPHAMLVSRHLGINHEVIELGQRDLLDAFEAISERLSEPLGDSSLLPTYLVCRAARRSMTVALAGDGADELFAGYPNFVVQRYALVMRLLPASTGRLIRHMLRAVPSGQSYMNRRFLLQQLSQGLGTPATRQSFLWMAPFAPEGLQSLWAPGTLPAPVPGSAFASLDRYTAATEGLSPVD